MSILQDIRYGLRMIAKAPGFTLLATLALALGICANTTIFSFINALILRPLTSVTEPDRLVAVYASDYSSGLYGASSYPEYVDIRDQLDVFENLAAFEDVVFNASDESETKRLRGFVVIVNEELARRYYGGNAVGKRLQMGSNVPSREIVGVARTAKYRNLREEPLPFIYVPFGQEYQSGMTLLVRTKSDPQEVVGSLQREMRALNKDVPLFGVQTVSERIGGELAADRMIAVLLSVFGAGALLLAAIGIYGLMGYAVAQRTHEIGIRLALGAEHHDILKLIVGQGMFLIAIGAGIGLALALAATQVLKSLLFGISATDPLTFASVIVVLVGVALLACYLPARRATKVDPLVALRYE